MLKTRILNL